MSKPLDRLESLLQNLAGAFLCVMTISIFWQVVARYVLRVPNVWGEELARYSFEWMVMLAAPVAIRRSRHVAIEFVLERFPRSWQVLLRLFSVSLCAILCAVLGWEGLRLLPVTSRQLSPGMVIPMSYPYLAIPVGSALMSVFLGEYAVALLKGRGAIATPMKEEATR